MIIFFWILSLLLFGATCAVLLHYVIRNIPLKGTWQIVINGAKDALKGCGFIIADGKKGKKMYRWITVHDDRVCTDCQKRADWPAMEIADWIEKGFPGSGEANTHCQKNCRCHLQSLNDSVYVNDSKG